MWLGLAPLKAPPRHTYRPCLCRFFTKGTVTPAVRADFLTVPLPFFYKRHGHLRHSGGLFDRAFVVFLQKVRSFTPSGLNFRPCLCRFFAKGTVTYVVRADFSTVPLPFFLQKARLPKPSGLTFRPCLCRFFTKGTVTPAVLADFSTVPLSFFYKRHGHSSCAG